MTTKALTVKSLFAKDEVKKKFNEMLGKRSAAFMTSVVQIVSQSENLAKCEPMSIFNAAAMAATLDLPINSQLGFAYILPYRDKASFQLGYRAYIQLAQRTGQFKTISATPVYEGQIVSENPLTGFEFDWSAKKSETLIGFAAYFELLNGFQKTLYMTRKELEDHGMKYSKTFRKGFGLWKTDFEAMASKTVLKLLLSKFAPLSIEMQQAVIVDQAVINDHETQDITYVDNDNGGDAGSIEAAPDKKEKPVMNPEYSGWEKARTAYLKGNVTVDDIRGNYILSEEDEKLLTAPEEAVTEEVKGEAPAEPESPKPEEKKAPAKTVDEIKPATILDTEGKPKEAKEKEEEIVAEKVEPEAEVALPTLNEKHEKWESARNAILGGHTSIEAIRKQYTVSDEDALKLEVPPIPKS